MASGGSSLSSVWDCCTGTGLSGSSWMRPMSLKASSPTRSRTGIAAARIGLRSSSACSGPANRAVPSGLHRYAQATGGGETDRRCDVFLFGDPSVLERTAGMRMPTSDPVIDLIERGQAEGAFDPDVSARWIHPTPWALVYRGCLDA